MIYSKLLNSAHSLDSSYHAYMSDMGLFVVLFTCKNRVTLENQRDGK